MSFKFNGQEYELDEAQGLKLVETYRAAPFNMTDTVIAGLLAQFKKNVDTVVRKSAETIMADIKSKVLEDATVKATMPKIAATYKRYCEIGKQLDELDAVVVKKAMELARESGMLADGIRYGWSAEKHEFEIAPVKKAGTGHGGSAAGGTKFTQRKVTTLSGATIEGATADVAQQLIKLGMQTEIHGTEKNEKGDEKKWTVALSKDSETGKLFYAKWLDMLLVHGQIKALEKYNLGKDGKREQPAEAPKAAA